MNEGLGKKLVVGALTIALAVGYVAKREYVNQGIADFFGSAKAGVVNIFTNDVGEVADELTAKIMKTKDTRALSEYGAQLQDAAYAVFLAIPPQTRQETLTEIVSDQSDSIRKSVLEVSYTSLAYGDRAEFLQEKLPELNYEDSITAVRSLEKKVGQETLVRVEDQLKKVGDYLRENIGEPLKRFRDKYFGNQ